MGRVKLGWEAARRAVEEAYGLPTGDTGMGTASLYVVPVKREERRFNDMAVFVDRATGEVYEADRRTIPENARRVP